MFKAKCQITLVFSSHIKNFILRPSIFMGGLLYIFCIVRIIYVKQMLNSICLRKYSTIFSSFNITHAPNTNIHIKLFSHNVSCNTLTKYKYNIMTWIYAKKQDKVFHVQPRLWKLFVSLFQTVYSHDIKVKMMMMKTCIWFIQNLCMCCK